MNTPYRTLTAAEWAVVSEHAHRAQLEAQLRRQRFSDVRPVADDFSPAPEDACGERQILECEREWARTHWWICGGLLFGIIFWGALAGLLASL